MTAEEFLLLADCRGDYFAIPRAVAEAHRAPAETIEDLRQRLATGAQGAEVSGHDMFMAQVGNFLSAPRVPADTNLGALTATPTLDYSQQHCYRVMTPYGYRWVCF